jgi:Domain of unknown function (DUF4129)
VIPVLLQASPASPDSLRAVLDTVFASPEYRWVERPHPLASLLRGWLRLQEYLDRIQAQYPGLFWVVFWALLVLLVAIFVHGVWVTVQTLRAAVAPPAVAGPASPESRGATWYRREALRLASQGRYPQAMQADFLALVLELDQRQLLRFHPSKTPSEYTDEVQLPEPGREAFRDLVGSLYGYAFAGKPCGAEQFDGWRQRTAPEQYAGAH